MEITQDVRTLEELVDETSEVIRQVRMNHRPMLITSKGQPELVIIPAELMSSKLTALKATCALAEC